jgi:hypothetical protein
MERTYVPELLLTIWSADKLREFELTLGEVGDAEQSVIYADRNGDAF